MSERKASIDIGSNSALLLAADLEDHKIKKILANESRVTGLGRGLDKNGKFMDIAMEETFEALREYVRICADLDISPDEIIATATEASRVSSNSGEFYKRIKNELSLSVKIISGEQEATYSTKGVLLGAEPGVPHSIMDIGGASTEFIAVNKEGEITDAFSVPVGSVRMTDWLAEGVAQAKLTKIFEDWGPQFKKIKTRHLICVAGTMTSLANMHLKHAEFEEKEVHGHKLSKEDVEKMWKDYKNFSAEDFLNEFPFLGKRSNAIRGGLLLATRLGEFLDVETFEASTYGLRYGALISRDFD